MPVGARHASVTPVIRDALPGPASLFTEHSASALFDVPARPSALGPASADQGSPPALGWRIFDALRLLQQAQAYSQAQDWPRAKACATQAIEANPNLTEAYLIRAIANRCLADLDSSIADYTRVIELDEHNGLAWMFRGACKAQKASCADDRSRSVELLAQAHPDYQRAAELKPDDEQAGLALLELEICIGKYREAVGTTGEWWGRIQQPNNKLVCAWLGAIAMILAGRPVQKWSHLQEFVRNDRTILGPTDWCVVEIERCLAFLQVKHCPQLAEVKAIHDLFLGHFGQSGPAIR
jgi:tetratricopeptide (TPR) repeat protein